MARPVLTSIVLACVSACGGSESDSAPEGGIPAILLNPAAPQFNQTAPDNFRARFETSEGAFVVEVHRDWSPNGADRFFSLVDGGFYDGVRFFRVVDGFMAQFGLHGDPRVSEAWSARSILDDPVVETNTRGRVTFAKTGSPNSRTTQLFINTVDNVNLDEMGFSPFGEVVEGMAVVDALHAGYGEGAPRGQGPRQDILRQFGNAYLERDFPELDYVISAEIVEAGSAVVEPGS